MSLGATRWPHQRTRQRSCEDVVCIMRILIPRQQSSSKEHQSPRRKRDKRKQQSGSPLNRKPQADWAYSCLRSPVRRTSRTTTKHKIKNSCKSIKKAAMRQLRHASCARHLLDERRTRSTDAVPNDNKASASCDDNNKDKIYHLHFDKKKLKAGCVVVVFFARLTIEGRVESKERKEREVSFIFEQRSLILQTPS
jgi:hypothetical protein